jgi:hypothetical protein
MPSLPLPISILEDYFGVEVSSKNFSFFDEIDADKFVDFAKTYLSVMERGFTLENIVEFTSSEKIRLFFDRGFHEAYDYEIKN